MRSPWNKLVSPSPNLLGLHTDVKYAILLCLRCHQKSTWALLVLEHHFLPFIPARTFAFPLNKNQELTFDIKGVIGSFSAATSFCMRASRIIKFVALVSWVRRSGSSDCISSDYRKTKTQVITKALSWKFCKLSDSEQIFCCTILQGHINIEKLPLAGQKIVQKRQSPPEIRSFHFLAIIRIAFGNRNIVHLKALFFIPF